MLANIIHRDVVVGLADGPGKARTARGDRLEAEMLQRLGTADIERVRQHEAAALMHLEKGGALVSSCQRHCSLPCCCSRELNIVARPSRHNLAQEAALLGENELALLGDIEIRHALGVAAQL